MSNFIVYQSNTLHEKVNKRFRYCIHFDEMDEKSIEEYLAYEDNLTWFNFFLEIVDE